MRVYFYLLAGLASALIGWNIGQIFLTDLRLLRNVPEVVLFPCVAIALAVGLVANEIFVSNPTRPKLNFRIIKTPLLIAAGLGLAIGLAAGGIAQIAFLPEMPGDSRIVRIVGWLLIGFSVGLAEGLAWRWRSMEARDYRRYRRRLMTSILAALSASLVAALLFEWIRTNLANSVEGFSQMEDPLGFSILGLLLGLALSLTTSPGYMVALRAGAGFEYLGEYSLTDEDSARIQRLKLPILKFISQTEEENAVQEGLSIQLPASGTLRVGSSLVASNIYLPGLPAHVADLELKGREALLDPNPKFYSTIAINGEPLRERRKIPLRHNCVLTFNTVNGASSDGKPNSKKFYRFVYYNRFLDPQA